MIRYLRLIIAVILAGWTVVIIWHMRAEEKQEHLGRLLAQDVAAHIDSIDTQWGITSGHPEVMIYRFPSSEKQTVIIDRIRRRKQDLQIIQPVTVTFRAYPIKVIKNGQEANGKYAPDSVIRAVTL